MGLKVITRKHVKNYVEIWVDKDQLGVASWSFAPDDSVLLEIDQWVEEHQVGRRTAYNGWQLHNPQCLTMFMLRWSEE